MAPDSEQQVRLQFLDEAWDYIDQIESGLLGISISGADRAVWDSILRAAHSIKGGAAMMSYPTLSQLAHRLEDNFKVVKGNPAEHLDNFLEQLLLTGVDHLRQVANGYRQGETLDEDWLAQTVYPTFDILLERLGEPTAEDSTTLLSEEMGGEDVALMLFESEVEGTLTRLEEVLTDSTQPCRKEEFSIAVQELAGLGEMLDLPAFSTLCLSIETFLNAAEQPAEIQSVTQLALETLRQAQAMVLIGQQALIPQTLMMDAFTEETASPADVPLELTLDLDLTDLALGIDLALDENIELDEISLELEEVAAQLATSDTLEQEVGSTPAEPTLNLDDFNFATDTFIGTFAALDLELVDALPAPEPQAEVPQVTPPQAIPTQSKTTKATTTTSRRQTTSQSNTPESEDQTLRVSLRQLNQLNELFGELVIERNGIALYLKRIREQMTLLTQRVQTLEQSNTQLRSAYDKVATDTLPSSGGSVLLPPAAGMMSILSDDFETFDLLEMDRYSELHSFSQELMETAVQIQEVGADLTTHLQDAEQTTRELTRTTKQLQVGLTQLRMRPLSDVVSRYPRMLRDWALQYGKDVDLKITGASTLVDRSILDVLSDPLLHILRNAYDHGIETPQQRQDVGKSAKGRIEISATYRGNQTLITLRDDGGGISLDKVKAKALNMGLDSATVQEASESQLLDLIFEPGFSTASEVTELSGRGVGMDIVRTNLEKVGGTITVTTQVGEGTTFTIAVPYTLSVIRVLLVESGNLVYAFPTDAVEEMRLLNPDELLHQNGQTLMTWEDMQVPVIPLHRWLRSQRPLQLTENDAISIINQPSVLMIGMEEEAFALQVERYWGEQEVTIRQVEGDLPLPTGFSGCTILGDGRIAPLVDPFALISHILQQQASPEQSLTDSPTGQLYSEQFDPSEITNQPTVMVVDDSVNVRRFMAITLAKAGFRVEQAKDGQDALDKLNLNQQIQAIVCDVEMPRLDGFGFLAHAKSNPQKKHIPVVMLTSRSGDKHRALATRLGASAYFSKPFREQELLTTLNELIQSPVPQIPV
jgi:two-component system, chemotaxis family, sensor histidine kinase and response regulator PixL